MTFLDKLKQAQLEKESRLCVGIDPDIARIPTCVVGSTDPDRVINFCRSIIEATLPYASSFKFNFAFFESLGNRGHSVLRKTRQMIPDRIPVIADAKRGDIGNTARFYAQSVFTDLRFDAITVSPYMGRDSVLPFLEFSETCTFVLARTSNPGGDDFQLYNADGKPLFEAVALQAAAWGASSPGQTGLVAGATDVGALKRLRTLCPELPFLIPGIGSQGGDLNAVMAAASKGPVIINSSRSILYASSTDNFEDAAADAANTLRLRLEKARSQI